ncbi:MAG: N-acyl homoserine lactonase family protein [Hyphomonadaceae bacterium]|nr:N-acyl homoserine lactonase family protein [Hyphomonadaceae bacterium]
MAKRALAILAVAALAACAPPAAEAPAPAVRLYAMDCGRIEFPDVNIFADDGSMAGVARTLVDPCFLIRHPNGDLLWDAGFPDAIAAMPNGLQLPQMGGGVRVVMPASLTSQLAQLSLTPADVEFISFSHMHADHTGNGNLFAASTWIVDADERAAMFSDAARADAQSFGAYNQLETANTQLIEGDADHDVFGDGSVTIIQAPGHTPGHAVLLVRLPNAGPVLLTGDMFHLAETRERRLVPSFNVDRAQTLASMDKVERIATETGARVIRQHVAQDIEALPRFPEALN